MAQVSKLTDSMLYVNTNKINKQLKFCNFAGSLMNYTNFYSDAPTKNTDDCFQVNKWNGYKWSDVSCAFNNSYICQIG